MLRKIVFSKETGLARIISTTKAQAAAEMLVILAIGLALLLTILAVNDKIMTGTSSRIETTKSHAAVDSLSDAAELVYQQGVGSRTRVFVTLPDEITGFTASEQTLTMQLSAGGSTSDIYRNLDFNISGTLPTEAGNHWLYVEAKEGYVEISKNITVEVDSTPPALLNVRNGTVTNESAVILWNTDENSDSVVYYGLTESLGSEESDATQTLSHSVTITGLTNNTLYYYKVGSCDASGNCANSSISNFMTAQNPGDSTPPATVTNLNNKSAGTTWIYWNWTNPTDSDFSQAIIYINGTNVANASNNYYNATGLAENTYYTITVHTKDATGNVNDTDVNSTATTISSGLTIIGETGEVSISNHNSVVAAFQNTYSSTPIVIATPATQNAGSADDDSALIPVIESLNRTHAVFNICQDNGASTCDVTVVEETLHYFVFDMDAELPDWIALGTQASVSTDGANTAINFGKTFSNTPYLFTQAQTNNQGSNIAPIAWVDDVTTTGANIIGCVHQETGDSCTGSQPSETFGWIAIDVAEADFTNTVNFQYGSEDISNSAWTAVSWTANYTSPRMMVTQNDDDGGQDPQYAWARDVDTSSPDIRYCEQDGADDCDSHTSEWVSWFTMEQGHISLGTVETSDTTPPASITNLSNQSAGTTWIYWNWTNPTDSDFSQAIIYINGTNIANTSGSYYNATDLETGTAYTITVHTEDDSGNINDTDVNSTAATQSQQTTAILTYYDSGSSNTPRYRLWDGDSWSGEGSTNNVGGNNLRWHVLQASPSEDEMIFGVQDNNDDINFQVWDGDSWGNLLEASTDCYYQNQRTFDIAYEESSGRALVAYMSQADSTLPRYRIWDGSWGSEQTDVQEVSPYGYGIRWVKLASRPGSDEIIMVTLNNYWDLYAQVWDGSAWGDLVYLEGNPQTVSYEEFDVICEQASPYDCVVAWADTSSSSPRYRVWDGSSWSSEQAANSVGSSNIYWIRLAADPNSDDIIMGTLDSGRDINVQIWNGGSWGSNTELDSNVETNSDRCFDVAYESTTSRAIMAYGERSDNTPKYFVYDGSWGLQQSSVDVGADPEWVVLEPHPETDDIFLVIADDNSDVSVQRWTGTGWTDYEEIETSSAYSEESVSIAYSG